MMRCALTDDHAAHVVIRAGCSVGRCPKVSTGRERAGVLAPFCFVALYISQTVRALMQRAVAYSIPKPPTSVTAPRTSPPHVEATSPTVEDMVVPTDAPGRQALQHLTPDTRLPTPST